MRINKHRIKHCVTPIPIPLRIHSCVFAYNIPSFFSKNKSNKKTRKNKNKKTLPLLGPKHRQLKPPPKKNNEKKKTQQKQQQRQKPNNRVTNTAAAPVIDSNHMHHRNNMQVKSVLAI